MTTFPPTSLPYQWDEEHMKGNESHRVSIYRSRVTVCRLRHNCQMLSRSSMPDCGMTDNGETCWLATATDLIVGCCWFLSVADVPGHLLAGPPGGKCHSVFNMMSTIFFQCRCGTLNPQSSGPGYVIDSFRWDSIATITLFALTGK